MSTKTDCSLRDTKVLRDLILENPDLPLLVFVSEDAWSGDFRYSQVGSTCEKIEELILYKETWLDKEDYAEKLADSLYNKEEYKNMSFEDFNKVIDRMVEEAEFVKTITIWCN